MLSLEVMYLFMQTSQRHALWIRETVHLLCLRVKMCYLSIIKSVDCTVRYLREVKQTQCQMEACESVRSIPAAARVAPEGHFGPRKGRT